MSQYSYKSTRILLAKEPSSKATRVVASASQKEEEFKQTLI